MGLPSAPHTEEHQYDHHRNGDETAAAAAVSPAAIVVTATTVAGRAAKVAVEGCHVLGIAHVAFAKVAVITVCLCVFLRPKCVLLLLRSF